MTYRLHVVRDSDHADRPDGYCSVHAEPSDGVTFRVGEVWRERRQWFGSLGWRQPAQTGPHRTRYAAFAVLAELHAAERMKP